MKLSLLLAILALYVSSSAIAEVQNKTICEVKKETPLFSLTDHNKKVGDVKPKTLFHVLAENTEHYEVRLNSETTGIIKKNNEMIIYLVTKKDEPKIISSLIQSGKEKKDTKPDPQLDDTDEEEEDEEEPMISKDPDPVKPDTRGSYFECYDPPDDIYSPIY